MAEEARLPEVPHKSLRAAAYAAIRNAILSGKIKPGSRLIEVELAQQLGISRAPVREALRQLETEGLISGRPHRGLYVAHLSPADLWEIYTLRAAIEGLAVRIVAEQRAPEVIGALETLVHRMREAVRDGDRATLTVLDLHYHEIICTAARHRRLEAIWKEMQAQVRMFVSITDQHQIDPARLVAYHEEVLAAVQAGEPERAERVLVDHILTIGQQVAAALETGERTEAREASESAPVEPPLPVPT